jgi:cobalt-zinc-cadmium efflux system protein
MGAHGTHASHGRHGHRAGAASADQRRRLTGALVLTAVVMVAEVVGAVLSGSLALGADAGHMFTDVAAIGIALTAMTIAQRRTTARSTFGLYRLEIFAAALNAVVLLAVAGWVVWIAVRRLDDAPQVHSSLMLAVAMLGLAANATSLWWLHGGRQESLNVRGAYLEVLGDLLGSAAVVVAAVLIAVTDRPVIDPIASLVVAALIVPRTWTLLREAVTILLEATPAGTDLDHVRSHIIDVPGVVDVHDLHVWTISSGRPVMSAHVVVDARWLARSGEVLDALQSCLGAHFDVEHCTFQVEPPGHAAHEAPMHP